MVLNKYMDKGFLLNGTFLNYKVLRPLNFVCLGVYRPRVWASLFVYEMLFTGLYKHC